MKATITIIVLLAVVAPGRMLVVTEAGDPNCVPVAYSPSLLPEAIDPNCIVGSLLPPIPGDPNTWQLPAGKWNRPAAKACDAEGDSFTIEYTGGTLTGVSILHDIPAGLWTCAVDLTPGVHALQFKVTDAPLYAEPKSRDYTICFEVLPPPNTAPVLE